MTQMDMRELVKYRTKFSRNERRGMADSDWKIALVIRTIGAERGRAARGGPVPA
jgi:hypothetical protein